MMQFGCDDIYKSMWYPQGKEQNESHLSFNHKQSQEYE